MTICDRIEFRDTPRCVVERCDRFPDREECANVEKCKIVRDCLGDKKLTDPRCCPSGLCSPKCVLFPTLPECVVDPPEKCTWGYYLGEHIVDLMVEPI